MLQIQKLFIKYNFSNRSEKIKYIVIHDVGARSTAKNNRDYFNGENRNASADFFVDSTNIIQAIDYNSHYSWAIGDGSGKYGKTNGNSLSIEMCLEANLKPSTSTVNNTIDLVKYLMNALSISADNVVRHYDCSHKTCPGSFSANNWAAWTSFKKQLTSTVTAKVSSYTPVKLGEVTATKLNQRDHADVTSAIVSSFKKGDVVTVYGLVNGFYSVSEHKVGKWISAAYVKDITPAVVAPVPTPMTNEVYRVVTGSFNDEANADKRIEELKKLGVDSFKIIK